jgi:outer membrane protein assembly factor BamB
VFAIGEPQNWVVDPEVPLTCFAGGYEWSGASTVVAADQVVRRVPAGLEAYPLADCGAAATGSCTPSWSAANSGFTLVALANGDIVTVDHELSTSTSVISVLDATTHTVEWTARVDLGGVEAASSSTIFARGIGGSFRTVTALPADGCGAPTCGQIWKATLPSDPTGMAIGGDVLYVGGADGTVMALPANGCGAATCDVLWTRPTGTSTKTGPLMIVNGTVVAGSEDGTVTAFRLSDG